MNTIKNITSTICAAALVLTAGCCTVAAGPFYSADLIRPGTVIAGTTNLDASNYPSDGWVETKAGQDVTIQTVTAQVTTNTVQYATNLTAYLHITLDSQSKAYKKQGQIIAVDLGNVPATTNATTSWTVSVPATNFLGCQWFRLYALQYSGTNNVVIQSARAGYHL